MHTRHKPQEKTPQKFDLPAVRLESLNNALAIGAVRKEIRVVMVGDAQVGKTSLVLALYSDSYEDKKVRCHRIAYAHHPLSPLIIIIISLSR
jgi:GTPase SAR1 family protein